MLCYMDICIAPLAEGYSEVLCSQRDRQVLRKVFKLRRNADDIPCSITLRSAVGVSFQSAGPTPANARFWDREVRDQCTRRSQRSAERSGREERADSDKDTHQHWGL